MPGFLNGKLKMESTDYVRGSEIERISDTAASFLKPIPRAAGAETGPKNRAQGVDSFLAFGEKDGRSFKYPEPKAALSEKKWNQNEDQAKTWLREEIRRIFNDLEIVNGIRRPEDALAPLARRLGFSKEIYTGLLLKSSSHSHLEAWLNLHRPKPGRPEEEKAYKKGVIQWLELHEIRTGLPELKIFLRDSDPEVQWLAARALFKFGEGDQAFPVLSNLALNSDNELVRFRAVEVLKDYGPGQASEVLLAIARNAKNDPALRVEAADILTEWGDRAALATAQDLLKEWMVGSHSENESENHWELYYLFRAARAFKRLGLIVDVSDSIQNIMALRPNPYHLSSMVLEDLVKLYGELAGPVSQNDLLNLAANLSLRPELRSGAIEALGKMFTPECSQLLLKLAKDGTEWDGVRLAALRVLIEHQREPDSLSSLALDLVKSDLLFVRFGAVDLLIKMGEEIVALMMGTFILSGPHKALEQAALEAWRNSIPFAEFEIKAFGNRDQWFLQTLSRLEPALEKRFPKVNYETVLKIIREEMSQHEQKPTPIPSNLFVELEMLLDPKFNWEGIKGTPEEFRFAGLLLSKGIFFLAQNEANKPGILESFGKDAVEATALAAKTQLISLIALLILHKARNPHAFPALLDMDISDYLGTAPTNALAYEVLVELAELGHRDAQVFLENFSKEN